MPPPPPLQFAAPPALPPPDATGAQAIGGLAQLATALQSRVTQRPGAGGAGTAMGGAMGQLTDGPTRRKTPFAQAAGYA